MADNTFFNDPILRREWEERGDQEYLEYLFERLVKQPPTKEQKILLASLISNHPPSVLVHWPRQMGRTMCLLAATIWSSQIKGPSHIIVESGYERNRLSDLIKDVFGLQPVKRLKIMTIPAQIIVDFCTPKELPVIYSMPNEQKKFWSSTFRPNKLAAHFKEEDL